MILLLIHILLYVHSNRGAIDLLVTGCVISHFVTGHNGLSSTSVHIELVNTKCNACTPSCVCYRPRGDQYKRSNFVAGHGHHGPSSIHVVHHT